MKYIDADKLIAEIERKRDSALERQKNLEKIGQETVLNEMIAAELNRLISFVASLRQEQSEVDLEEEARNYLTKNFTPPGEEPLNTEDAAYALWFDDVCHIARHFAEWGMNQCPLPEDTTIFQKGVAEGKRLMMEGAVEHYVVGEIAGSPVGPAIVHYDENLNIGDKVKVIVIKED